MTSLAYIFNSATSVKYKDTFSEIIVVSFILGIYNFSPYYSTFLTEETKIVISLIGILYILYSALKTFFTGKQTHLKYYLLYEIFSKIFEKYFNRNNYTKNSVIKILPEEKLNDLLFLTVKIFYIPVMLNFTITNFKVVFEKITEISFDNLLNVHFFYWYGLIVSIFFLIDTSYFLFGYLVESKKLGSTIRSVDKSVISWIFTLACYPPFNIVTAKLFPWVADEKNLMYPDIINYIILGLIIVLFSIYLSATVSLGSKCSNLTNRGTVSRGPYKYVRHPAYSTKVLAWWLMALPIMNLFVFFNMLMWSVIYIVRALKEEDHLLKDTEYQNYYKKTPYRFIPKMV